MTTVRPRALNAGIAWLFIVGSALFALGSVPAYANAVGATADSVTYFVGSIFFTAASFSQLLQAQTPAMTDVDADSQHTRAPVRFRAWLPHDRNWLAAVTQFPGTLAFNISTLAALAHNATVEQQDRRIWRPDFYGSTLFLIASVFAILACGTLPQLPAALVSLAHRLVEHDRINLVHDLRAGELCPAQDRRVDQQPGLDRRHAARRTLFPDRSDPDVPGLETCGSPSASLAS